MDANGNPAAHIVVEIRRAIRFLHGPEGVDISTPALAYRRLEALGADQSLLAAVGSWRDTLDDSEVLKMLKDWNAQR